MRRLLRNNAAILTLAWAVVWALAAAAGLRFDTAHLGFWHFVEPALLKSAPIQSLYYLHAQPPLFNCLLAAALAVFGDDLSLPFYIAFALMALGTVLAVSAVVQEMTGNRASALVAGFLVLLSPALIAYGHVLFHALPATFLLTTCIWAFRRAVVRPSWGRLCLVVGLMTGETLLWSAFHPLWMAIGLVWLLWAVPGERARAAVVAAAPVALVAALLVKNGIVFGVWDLSSWTGMNLGRITVQQIPKSEREAAVASGELSPVARVRPFAILPFYRAIPDPPATGIPLLDRPFKSDGQPNYHHLKYVEISRLYRRDALTVIRTRPGAYLSAIARGFWLYYLRPSTDFHVVSEPIRKLGAYAALYDAVVYGAPPGRPGRFDMRNVRGGSFWPTFAGTGALLRLWFLAVLIGGPAWVARMVRSRRLRTPDGLTAGLLVGSILYVTVICSLAEIGENQRFRFTVEPAAIMLAVIGATAVCRGIRRRLRFR